jgi:hypothetical protein
MISRQDRPEQSELEISVDSLRDEVRVLREVLDEIREALQWQNNNAADFPSLAANRPHFWSLAEATLFPTSSPTDVEEDAK